MKTKKFFCLELKSKRQRFILQINIALHHITSKLIQKGSIVRTNNIYNQRPKAQSSHEKNQATKHTPRPLSVMLTESSACKTT